jgi:CYTH domain-containing protein
MGKRNLVNDAEQLLNFAKKNHWQQTRYEIKVQHTPMKLNLWANAGLVIAGNRIIIRKWKLWKPAWLGDEVTDWSSLLQCLFKQHPFTSCKFIL